MRRQNQESLDSGERQSTRLIAKAIGTSYDAINNRLKVAKRRLVHWSIGQENDPERLDTHVFYVHYSAILNMAYAASAILDFDLIGPKGPDRWCAAMRAFSTGCVAVYSAIELVGHLGWVLDNPAKCRSKINGRNWKFEGDPKLDSKLDVLANDFKPPFEIEGNDPFVSCRKLLRHKVVHGPFTYVVVLGKNRSQAGGSTWVVIDPKAGPADLNRIREQVNRGPWDKLSPRMFLHRNNHDGNPVEVPAPEVLRHLLTFSVHAYEQVAYNVVV